MKFKRDKYLARLKGCETNCPCCGRSFDAEHYKVKTEIGSATNKHKCNRGHQFRGMNGFKYENSNLPSFKICETMKDTDLIRSSNKDIKWSDYKALNSKWNFDNDSNQNAIDWTNKCPYIWSMIGKDLCVNFDMKFTRIAIDENSSESCGPLHYILVLDESGSMRGCWSDLLKSVESFLKIRSSEGSLDDLVSIILFSNNATIEVSNSKIDPGLINNLRQPIFGGTDYSTALQRCIQIISQSSSSSHKYGVLFMSDGEAYYPTNEIKMIKDNYLQNIYKFWCIGYRNDNFPILKNMLKELYGNEDNFKNPLDLKDLVKTYIEIAREE